MLISPSKLKKYFFFRYNRTFTVIHYPIHADFSWLFMKAFTLFDAAFIIENQSSVFIHKTVHIPSLFDGMPFT